MTEMKTVEAGSFETVVICVYLDGQEVTDFGTRAYVSTQPSAEVDGWVDLFIFDEDGVPEMDEENEAITVREYGKVRWERE